MPCKGTWGPDAPNRAPSLPRVPALAAGLAFGLAFGMTGCLTPNRARIDANLSIYGSSASFYVDSVRAGENKADELDSWGFPRRKMILITACLKDRAAMQPILNHQPFTVNDGKANKLRYTDFRGCIEWREYHEFDFLAPETYIPIERTITAIGAHSGSVTLSMALDPWDDGPSVLADLRVDNVPKMAQPTASMLGFESVLSAPGAKSAVLDIKTLTLQFLGLDRAKYKVDTLLDLSVSHSYRLQMIPTVMRRDLNGTLVPKAPDTGKIRFTMVLIPNSGSSDPNSSPKASQVIAATQQEMPIFRNQVISNMTLDFPDVSSVTSRVQALIEVEPLLGSANLDSAKFQGVIGPLPGVGFLSANLVPIHASAARLYQDYRKLLDGSRSSAPDGVQLFARRSGFHKLDMPDLDGAGVYPDDLERIFQGPPRSATAATGPLYAPTLEGTSMPVYEANPALLRYRESLRRLCPLVYPDPTLSPPVPKGAGGLWAWILRIIRKGRGRIRRAQGETALHFCQAHPENAILPARRRLVHRLISDTPRILGMSQPETLTITTSFTETYSRESRTESDQQFTEKFNLSGSVSGKIGLGYDGKLLKRYPDPGYQAAEGPWHGPEAMASVGLSLSGAFDQQWFHLWATVNDSMDAATATQARTMTLSSVSNTFAIELEDRPCLILGPHPNAEIPPDGATAPGVFYCRDLIESRTDHETYYLITQTAGLANNPFSDIYDAHEMPFRMFVRGRKAYATLKAVLTDNPGLDLVLESAPNRPERLVGGVFNRHMIQDYPGMLSQ